MTTKKKNKFLRSSQFPKLLKNKRPPAECGTNILVIKLPLLQFLVHDWEHPKNSNITVNYIRIFGSEMEWNYLVNLGQTMYTYYTHAYSHVLSSICIHLNWSNGKSPFLHLRLYIIRWCMRYLANTPPPPVQLAPSHRKLNSIIMNKQMYYEYVMCVVLLK